MLEDLLWTSRYLIRSFTKSILSWPREFSTWLRFWDHLRQYRRLAPRDGYPSLKYLNPRLGDDTDQTLIEPVYFYQDNWAFAKIVRCNPKFHLDVGSHYKFVALLSQVVPVTMVDIRPLSLPLESLNFRKGSILDLPYEDGAVPSVSSLCVVEHIGLGRYGDELDPYGSEKAIRELKRIVQPEGNLYLSLPVDDENRIYFNAHRAFSEDYLLELFEPLDVVDCCFIYGENITYQRRSGFGTGCYHLRHS